MISFAIDLGFESQGSEVVLLMARRRACWKGESRIASNLIFIDSAHLISSPSPLFLAPIIYMVFINSLPPLTVAELKVVNSFQILQV